jgi:hypothetical protein
VMRDSPIGNVPIRAHQSAVGLMNV